VISENRYIAKRLLYGDEEEDDTPQPKNTMIEEPKVLGLNSSNEKVTLALSYVLMDWCNLTCLNC